MMEDQAFLAEAPEQVPTQPLRSTTPAAHLENHPEFSIFHEELADFVENDEDPPGGWQFLGGRKMKGEKSIETISHSWVYQRFVNKVMQYRYFSEPTHPWYRRTVEGSEFCCKGSHKLRYHYLHFHLPGSPIFPGGVWSGTCVVTNTNEKVETYSASPENMGGQCHVFLGRILPMVYFLHQKTSLRFQHVGIQAAQGCSPAHLTFISWFFSACLLCSWFPNDACRLRHRLQV